MAKELEAKDLLDTQQAADMLGISIATRRRWAIAGTVTSIPFGA